MDAAQRELARELDCRAAEDRLDQRQDCSHPRKHTLRRPATADEPQWDDSLDEQFAQVGWQMLCVQQNQFFEPTLSE